MAGNSFYVHADLHTSSLSSVDAAVCGFGGDNELRTDLILVDNVLPAETVAVFFLNGTDHHDLTSFRDQIEIFHDPCAVYSGDKTAALVGHTASADLFVSFISFIGIEVPVVDVADAYGVDMRVIGDDLISGSHKSHNISLGVNGYFVKIQSFHLSGDGLHMGFLIAALTGISDDGSQKSCHVVFVVLSSLVDLCIIHCVFLLF